MKLQWLGSVVILGVVAAAVGCSKRAAGPEQLERPSMDSGLAVPDAGSVVPDSAADAPAALPVVLQRVQPDHGPFIGGTEVVLRGSGFIEANWIAGCESTDTCGTVTFGGLAVQEADIEFVDAYRIKVVVPAGMVGPADVNLTQPGSDVVLPGGFTYDAFYVTPNLGAVSGGTFVNLIGDGTAFAEGMTVKLGALDCTDLAIVSENRATCRTPASPPGTVDVQLTYPDSTEIVVEDGFTYYDAADPFGGGLGGGAITGTVNITAVNAMTGGPVDGAFAIVGEDFETPYQGLTDAAGQITFSGADLEAPLTVHLAKFCFEKASFVAIDAANVTVFMTPWMDPSCGMGMGGGGGRGREGAVISGELVWYGPNENGPNPWLNIPEPRANEIKVAYVYTTQASADSGNPDPAAAGDPRVLEAEVGSLGYSYSLFARPAGLAVYALAGLENTLTLEFTPYVMGVARNVLAGPGESIRDINIYMDIPLDHVLDVELAGLPGASSGGPNRYKVTANIDLGGEGVIVRMVNDVPIDELRGTSASRAYRFTAQPSLDSSLSDGRYTITAGWYTSEYDSPPETVRVMRGVSDVASTVVVDDFIGVPRPVSPADGDGIARDRMLRWTTTGDAPDFFVLQLIGGDGNPAWTHIAPGTVNEAPVPDFDVIEGLDDIAGGSVTWIIQAVSKEGFDYSRFTYRDLNQDEWSAYSLDYFTIQQ